MVKGWGSERFLSYTAFYEVKGGEGGRGMVMKGFRRREKYSADDNSVRIGLL